MDGNNAISGPTSQDVTATATTCTNSSPGVINELRENSSVSAGTATLPPPPDALQMASSPQNETQISSTPGELNYSQPNARPPGTCNINYGYQCESSKDSKDDLPSYEEAIKAMECSDRYQSRRVLPEDNDPMQYYRYPDNGQFGAQDQYFYPQSYHSYNTSDSNLSQKKSVCARLVSSLVLIGFAAVTVRMIIFMR